MQTQPKSLLRIFALTVLPFTILAFILSWLGPQTAVARPNTDPNTSLGAPAPSQAITLTVLGTYETGIFDAGAAEIVAFDPATERAFVVNGGNTAVDILDASDPTSPTLIGQIDITVYGGGVNSVAIYDGVLVAAVQNITKTLPGTAVFFDTDGTFISQVTVGALPDMVTFTPDGNTVLVANEGEPSDDYLTDPEGSVSIIDISGGAAGLMQSDVATADFTAYNGRIEELRARGIRIYGPGSTVAQDLEPEYIAVSPDGTTAFVTLQENNAFAVVDISTATIKDILPLGFKDHSQGPASLLSYRFDNLPTLGTTAGGQDILLGGLSGLWFEGMSVSGNYRFVTVPDRGPNGAPTDVDNDGEDERPFALPDYQARVIRFELNPTTSEIAITEQISLTRSDGVTPITGLPNIPGVDEEPVDLFGDPLPYDEFGADLEGIVIAPDDSFWMVDEYRPAIYHFGADGVLINRFVPAGTAALAGGTSGDYGVESLPAEYGTRRSNRGFEAVALDSTSGTLYAFIQTPLANPNRAASDSSNVIRILGIDTTSGQPLAEYVYLLEKASYRTSLVDKIGDAVYAGDGKFYVTERDSATTAVGKKFIYEIDLTGATNLMAGDYVRPVAAGVSITAVLTVGDAVSQTSNMAELYQMVGIPDGLGAYENGPDDVHLFLNHEFGNGDVSMPIINGATITGAFVSEYILASGGPQATSGDLAFTQVVTITADGSGDVTAGWLDGSTTFGRFCSGFLGGTSVGFSDWVYLIGEESSGGSTFDGLGAVAVAIADHTAYVLPEMGHFAKENVVALPGTGDTTVVFPLEDGPSGLNSQLYMYVGTKDAGGATAVERAGLVGGNLYFFRSLNGTHADEDSFHKGDGIINGEWVAVTTTLLMTETIANLDDVTLDARVQTANPFNFIRLEDGAWDHNQSGVFYFDTTGSTATGSNGFINNRGRLYRMTLDPSDPINGTTTLEVLLEGDTGDPFVNPDNIAVNAAGQLILQEDPNGDHQGAGLLDDLGRDSSIWLYDLPYDGLGTDGLLVRVAEVNQMAVPAGDFRGDRGSWETSGIIDVSDIYGAGTWLFDVQAHSVNGLEASQLAGSGIDLQLGQGGQLLIMNTSNVMTDTPTLEQLTVDELIGMGIYPVHKRKVTNLPSIGYLAGDKPEGLALLPDGSLAVLNDNDFGLLDEPIPGDGTIAINPDPVPVVLGIVSFEMGNMLDASNQDSSINLQNWPVLGMYQPDSIAAFTANGMTYYVTANEGDARDYDGYSEEERIGGLVLDTAVFPNAAFLQENANLGRLNSSTVLGDLDKDGDYDQLYSYGARSFSIWDEYGNLVFDSSDDFEQITAAMLPDDFNSTNDANGSFDNRSDDKGPEPEALAVGVINGRAYAFIGLERIGGIMVYDITDPHMPQFVQYLNNRDFTGDAEIGTAGDLGPEGIIFIAGSDSPTGSPMLIVANEISGSTTLYHIGANYISYLPFISKN